MHFLSGGGLVLFLWRLSEKLLVQVQQGQRMESAFRQLATKIFRCSHPVQFVRCQEVLSAFDEGAEREVTTGGWLSIISLASLLEAKIVSKEPIV